MTNPASIKPKMAVMSTSELLYLFCHDLNFFE